ncbi:hypothetical protein HDU93_005160 [Gonapodya sp. JEL0774]|nr:hypothetical protein HDU93_005160 [Gonapodya sp. JEL0774]
MSTTSRREQEEEPLLADSEPRTKSKGSSVARFALYSLGAIFISLIVLSVADMGWDVSRDIAVNAPIKYAATVLNDVATWPRWDVDLKKCDLDKGATQPAIGVTGTLHMKFGMSFPMSFVDVNLPDRVAYSTPFTGANLNWYWQFPAEKRTDTQFTTQMGVSCTGPLCWAYGLMLKNPSLKAFDKCLPLLKQCIEGEATGNPVPFVPDPDPTK